MHQIESPARRQLKFASLVILIVGLVSSAIIYLFVQTDGRSGINSVIIGGTSFETVPDESKRYLHDVELYGGKMAVYSADISRWFDSLWRGPQLASTIATLSILLALFGYLLANSFLFDEHDEHDSAPSAAPDQ